MNGAVKCECLGWLWFKKLFKSKKSECGSTIHTKQHSGALQCRIAFKSGLVLSLKGAAPAERVFSFDCIMPVAWAGKSMPSQPDGVYQEVSIYVIMAFYFDIMAHFRVTSISRSMYQNELLIILHAVHHRKNRSSVLALKNFICLRNEFLAIRMI